ncbi:hypothetical protein AB0N38_07505 [Micromonospora aurantiaca]|uniref:Uncharacterized protein n=2 Tax=Micromonospora TaxID=1873 RepID=A0A1C6SS16_9ACTN|nr:hypothetical protein [Micromonospora aurantiaca]AXH91648.1 hypothetical protein DVH21_17935 [Micromonospora aurantiaca]RNI06228.1 hypothetical protein EEZ25_03510 [Micromonospora aurantiaca]SCL32083.1 hypothetical protein GA0070615_1942 [Micromonospora aurantiaca]
MQIIEHSVLGTRSAVLRLRRPGSRLEFLVFPMLHVASPAFYAAVTKRLRECDLLVVEGVSGRSAVGSALTLTYRAMPANRRSGLVTDPIPYASLGVEVLNPDVSAAEFAQGWRAMPLRYRLQMWLVIPFVMVMQFFGGTRRLLSPEIEMSDLPSATDERYADHEFTEHAERAFGGERDERLLAALSELIGTRSAERIDVAVVYGAGHVPAIVRGLFELHGYRPRAAEWLTVLER